MTEALVQRYPRLQCTEHSNRDTNLRIEESQTGRGAPRLPSLEAGRGKANAEKCSSILRGYFPLFSSGTLRLCTCVMQGLSLLARFNELAMRQAQDPYHTNIRARSLDMFSQR